MADKKHCYSEEKNAQILIALLKAHGIRRVVACPGATNAGLVWMLQNDEFFILHSAVDERHASYLACGISEESGEPVVISCTGATASRNFMSALTEAFYRKLPILAVTSSMPIHRLGNLWPQMSDRTRPPSDTVKMSVQCPLPRNEEEERACAVRVNSAILELSRRGGGPSHINLETNAPSDFPVGALPSVTKIVRVTCDGEWATIPRNKKVAVWIGAHRPFSADQMALMERFATTHNAVIFADRTSNYFGASAIYPALLFSQGILSNPKYSDLCPDLLVHIGEISGDYPTARQLACKCEVWRVSEDGELRDYLQGLSKVFEMSECNFFSHYVGDNRQTSYRDAWLKVDNAIRSMLPDVPFSNIWIASQLSECVPANAEIHFGILNSLRSWNMFRANGALSYCNVGGFGIDGCVSSLIGASFVNREKIYYGVFGDLAFFYDLNSIGNRDIGRNLRIIVVNNGMGIEFKNPGSIGSRIGEGVEDYIAAGHHFGHQSRGLLKHMATDLGFRYLAAANKDEFCAVKEDFLSVDSDRSILLECFVDSSDDACALSAYRGIEGFGPPSTMRSAIGKMLPPRVKNAMRKVGL